MLNPRRSSLTAPQSDDSATTGSSVDVGFSHMSKGRSTAAALAAADATETSDKHAGIAKHASNNLRPPIQGASSASSPAAGAGTVSSPRSSSINVKGLSSSGSGELPAGPGLQLTPSQASLRSQAHGAGRGGAAAGPHAAGTGVGSGMPAALAGGTTINRQMLEELKKSFDTAQEAGR